MRNPRPRDPLRRVEVKATKKPLSLSVISYMLIALGFSLALFIGYGVYVSATSDLPFDDSPEKPVADAMMTKDTGVNVITMTTTAGVIKLEVVPEKHMPITVRAFLDAMENKFYVGTIFHRAEKGFLIQGGGRTGEGKYKSSPYHPVSVSEYHHPNEKYAMAMTQKGQEFFINCGNNTNWLGPGSVHNGKRTSNSTGDPVVARVIEGRDIVDKIERMAVTKSGIMNLVNKPVVITDLVVNVVV